MLVLTRKQNQTIKIGDNIEIKVLEIEGNQVKLGISAPKAVDIHREEVYVEIQEQNNEAANTSKDLLQLLNQGSKNK